MDDSQDYVTAQQFYLGMQELKLDTIAEVRNEMISYGVNMNDLIHWATGGIIIISFSIMVIAIAYVFKTIFDR